MAARADTAVAARRGVSQVVGKGEWKGKYHGGGKGSAILESGDCRSRGLYHDGRNPCNYFMAGHCRYGDRCTGGIHDFQYGLAFRSHWLEPVDLGVSNDSVARRHLFVAGAAAGRRYATLCRKQDLPRVGLDLFLPSGLAEAEALAAVDASPQTDTAIKHVLDYCSYLERFTPESENWANLVSFRRGRLVEQAPALIEASFQRFKEAAPMGSTEAGHEGASGSKGRWRRRQEQHAETKGKGVGKEAHQLLAALEPNPEGEVPQSKTTDPEYLLVLDLEGKDEITEFPVLVLRNGVEVDRFQRFVRPKYLFGPDHCFHEDCPSVPFEDCLRDFCAWTNARFGIDMYAPLLQPGQAQPNTINLGGLPPPSFAFVTCGDWDVRHIANQCRVSGMGTAPPGFRRFTNLKKVAGSIHGKDMTKSGMKGMLAKLGWLDFSKGTPLFGFHHSGMHDVENITMVLIRYLDMFEEVVDGLPVARLPLSCDWPRDRTF